MVPAFKCNAFIACDMMPELKCNTFIARQMIPAFKFNTFIAINIVPEFKFRHHIESDMSPEFKFRYHIDVHNRDDYSVLSFLGYIILLYKTIVSFISSNIFTLIFLKINKINIIFKLIWNNRIKGIFVAF